ncbi:MAG: hypothetical protein FWG05_03630 [Kiritimatiellaeota bacterium]|nr:hypothetical protein [Kiritimatiellota bacterium]
MFRTTILILLLAGASAALCDDLADAQKAQREAKAAADKIEAELKRVENQLRDKTRAAENSRAAAERDERQLEQIDAAIAKAKADLAANSARVTEVLNLAKDSAPVTKSAQEDSTTAQEALVESTKRLKELAEREEAMLEHLSQEQYVPPLETMTSFARLDIVDAYEKAKELEEKISESYREIKSAEAAMVRRMSFSGAKKLTDVAKTQRPQFDAELLRDSPRDMETFDRQKDVTMDVVREADSMVTVNEMLMIAAQEIVGYEKPHGPHAEHAHSDRIQRMQQQERNADRLEQLNQLAALNLALHLAAAEDEAQRAKDLAELMSGEHGPESRERGRRSVDMNAPGLVSDGSHVIIPGDAPSLHYNSTEVFPGNVINLSDTGDGVPAQWMYVNSWYTIGPFPNPDRINLRRRFAPESVVDLDATYIGKNERQLKWIFEQARSSMNENATRGARVVPITAEEYGIWYAYAEVFVDRDCDLWVAVGSDDRSDVWLNDMHIWGSSDILKVWQINEGFRRVHFNKGRNRILARIENGWHAIEWSVCIALTDNRPSL